MKILSIETSCDETALSILDVRKNKNDVSFTILGNAIASQVALHAQYGGVFPMMAKREHVKNILPLLQEVLRKSKVIKSESHTVNQKIRKKLEKILEHEIGLAESFIEFIQTIKKPKIDMIAVTSGPGLEPALWVGINFAQALSYVWDIPVVPVNHMEGHIFSIFPKNGKDSRKPARSSDSDHSSRFKVKSQKFPMLSLLVSGGHTELVLVKGWGKYQLLGQTRDDAAGEAFDKVARMLKLPYPGGPEISRLADQARKSKVKSPKLKVVFPRPMITSKNYDFSFSGLKTAVLYYIRDAGKLNKKMKSEIAREFEDAVIDVLVSKTMRAAKEYNAHSILIGGGVAANTHLRNSLSTSSANLNIPIHFPTRELSTDNSIMIGIAGYFTTQRKNKKSAIKADGNLSL